MLETEVIGKVYEVVGRRFRHLGMVRYYLVRGTKDMGLLLKFVIEKVVIILLVNNYFGQVPMVVMVFVDLMLDIYFELFRFFLLMTFYGGFEHLSLINSQDELI